MRDDGPIAAGRLLRAVLYSNSWPQGEGGDSILRRFAGTLAGRRGDGILATFANPHNAVHALLAANDKHTSAPSNQSAGIAFGEVATTPDDIFGEAVVAAARLAERAEPGTLFVTDRAAELVGPVGFDHSESADLKGIGDVRFHRLPLIGSSPHADAEPSTDEHVAVLSSDIVASTDLLEQHGTEAAVAVRQAFDDAVSAACAGGQIIEVTGDGVLVRFGAGSDAIDAAVQLHQAVADHSLGHTATGFDLRSGVASGLMGEATDAATQLERDCEPGQIRATLDSLTEAFNLAHPVDGDVISWQLAAAGPFPPQLVDRSDTPIVGRSAHLDAVLEQWDRAVRGDARSVFVTGDAGIGKTRLVSTIADRCHRGGALVLFGASDEKMAAPYRPFTAALRPFAERFERLSPLFPNQQQTDPRNNATEDGSASELQQGDRHDLFEAVSAALETLSEERPVLLVLDDLHWATRATALLVRHLVRRPSNGRVMVLGTFRDGEITLDHPLSDVIHDEEFVDRSTQVPLTPLSETDVSDLLTAHLGTIDEASSAFARRLHADAGGSPFFTTEILRSAVRDGALVGDGDLDVPDSLVGVISQRLHRLGTEAFDLLTVAAVVGAAFELDLLASTVNRPLGDVLSVVESAERLSLVRESETPGRYEFDHALVRTALLSGLSATRRSIAHQQIAEAIEALPGDRVGDLTHHWSEAAGPHALERTIHYLSLSASRDVAALAWESASERYGRVLELINSSGQRIEPSTEVELYLARAKAMRAAGDPEYLNVLKLTSRRARAAGLRGVLAQVALLSTKPGTWFANANEPDDQLIGLCEDALEADDLEPAVRSRVLGTLATNLAFDRQHDRRRTAVDEALIIARAIDVPDVLASALIAEYLSFWDPSTLNRRIEISEELARIAVRRDNPEYEFLAGFFRASQLLESGKLKAASQQLERLAEPIERTHNFWFDFLVQRISTAIAIARCEADAKEQVDGLFTRSVETQADAAGTWGAQLGALAIQTGTFGSMVDQLAAASERSRGQGVWSTSLALAQLDRGEPDAAQATLQRLGELPTDFMWLVSTQMAAEAAYRLGDTERCRTTLEQLRPYAGRVGVVASGTIVFGLVSTSIGELALGVGDTNTAETALRAAVEQADLLGLPFCGVRSRRRLLEVLGGTERDRVAAEALDVATSRGFAGELAALDPHAAAVERSVNDLD